MTHNDKFTRTATALLPHLGGTTNITTVARCVTRLLNQHHPPAHDPPTSAW